MQLTRWTFYFILIYIINVFTILSTDRNQSITQIRHNLSKAHEEGYPDVECNPRLGVFNVKRECFGRAIQSICIISRGFVRVVMKFALHSVNLEGRVSCTPLNYFPDQASWMIPRIRSFAAKNIRRHLFSFRRVAGFRSGAPWAH